MHARGCLQVPPSNAEGAEQPAAVPKTVQLDDAAKLRLVEGLVTFGVTWSVGASGDAAGRAGFDEHLRCAGGQQVARLSGLGQGAGGCGLPPGPNWR
jgi:hypothetical protein